MLAWAIGPGEHGRSGWQYECVEWRATFAVLV